MPVWSAVVVAVAMASVTAFAFGQPAAPPAGTSIDTMTHDIGLLLGR